MIATFSPAKYMHHEYAVVWRALEFYRKLISLETLHIEARPVLILEVLHMVLAPPSHYDSVFRRYASPGVIELFK